MFYMRDTYGLVIYRRLGDRLKQWNREDPVSAFERQRNDAIEKIQGNRNKYIDHPELADTIEF
jgi:deoxyribonuclease-1